MSANEDVNIVETYIQQGKTINNPFFICGPECDFVKHFGYLGALQRADYLTFQLPSHPYLCQIRKQSDIIYLFHIWGVLEGSYVEAKVTQISVSKTSSQSRHMYSKGKINHPFFIYNYMGHNNNNKLYLPSIQYNT